MVFIGWDGGLIREQGKGSWKCFVFFRIKWSWTNQFDRSTNAFVSVEGGRSLCSFKAGPRDVWFHRRVQESCRLFRVSSKLLCIFDKDTRLPLWSLSLRRSLKVTSGECWEGNLTQLRRWYKSRGIPVTWVYTSWVLFPLLSLSHSPWVFPLAPAFLISTRSVFCHGQQSVQIQKIS